MDYLQIAYVLAFLILFFIICSMYSKVKTIEYNSRLWYSDAFNKELEFTASQSFAFTVLVPKGYCTQRMSYVALSNGSFSDVSSLTVNAGTSRGSANLLDGFLPDIYDDPYNIIEGASGVENFMDYNNGNNAVCAGSSSEILYVTVSLDATPIQPVDIGFGFEFYSPVGWW